MCLPVCTGCPVPAARSSNGVISGLVMTSTGKVSRGNSAGTNGRARAPHALRGRVHDCVEGTIGRNSGRDTHRRKARLQPIGEALLRANVQVMQGELRHARLRDGDSDGGPRSAQSPDADANVPALDWHPAACKPSMKPAPSNMSSRQRSSGSRRVAFTAPTICRADLTSSSKHVARALCGIVITSPEKLRMAVSPGPHGGKLVGSDMQWR